MISKRGGARKGAGRPKGTSGAYKETKRDKKLTIQITLEEYERIEKCSNKLKLSKTNTIIKALGLLEKELD